MTIRTGSVKTLVGSLFRSRLFLSVVLIAIALNVVWLFSNYRKVKTLNTPPLVNWSHFILVTALLLATAAPASSANPPLLRLRRMFKESHVMPVGVVEHKGRYYVSDMKGNRILVFDRQQRLERTIGTVGSGPGELLRPGKLAISGDDLIYIFEGGNERVQVMTSDGRYVSHFQAEYTQGFAINSRGEVLLGHAQRGKLVTVCSKQGQPLRSFGELRSVSDFSISAP